MNSNKNINIITQIVSYRIIIFFFFLAFFSCRKEEFFTGSDKPLSFSTDTVMFDTIFTSIGSTTLYFKVYNNHDKEIKISSIYLAKGRNSSFRLNIDGYTTSSIRDVILPENDSIFIFVEVTIDPGRDEMVEQDSVVFLTNETMQDIDLVAYGQDVNLYNAITITNDTTWTNAKPFLIYDYIYIDTLKTLTIEAGTKIHFHHNASMYIGGTLIVNGTCEQPVIFQGDRLEEMYEDLPGQWGYIHLLAGSKANSINHAEIKNAIIGIRVDTIMDDSFTLHLSNTIIENMNAVGLYALGAAVLAENCVFANCGQIAAALTIGGYYEFYHCTFANFWPYGTRNTPSLVLNNYYQDIYGTIQVRQLASAYFGNCILYGGLENELLLDSFPQQAGYFSYRFENCLLKTTDTTNNSNHFINIDKEGDPKFVDIQEGNYELDTLSDAMDNGSSQILNDYYNKYQIEISTDLNCISRILGTAPDLGVYERDEN